LKRAVHLRVHELLKVGDLNNFGEHAQGRFVILVAGCDAAITDDRARIVQIVGGSGCGLYTYIC
jgi:hypothetical protein